MKRALEACSRTGKVETVPVRVLVAYDAAARVERILKALDATITARDFAAEVRYRVLVPLSRRSELATAVADVTAGRGIVTCDLE